MSKEIKTISFIKKLIICVVIFLILGIIIFSFIWYGSTKTKDKPYTSPINSVFPAEIKYLAENNINGSSIIWFNDKKYYVYKNIPTNTKSIVLNYDNLKSKDLDINIIWKYNNKEVAEHCLNIINEDTQNYLCFETNNRLLEEIWVDLNDENAVINNISFYNENLTYKELQIKTPTNILVIFFFIWILISSILSIATIIIISRRKNIKLNIKFNNKNFKILLLFLLVLVFMIPIEIILSILTLNTDSTCTTFNFSRYWFCCGVGICITLIFLIARKTICKIESIFAILALTFGTIMIVSAPLGHTATDLDSHFTWVIGPSNIYGYTTEAEQDIMWPNGDNRFEINLKDNNEKIERLNNEDQYTVSKTSRRINIAHLPGTILYSVCRLFKIPFTIKFDLVRFLYLLMYTFFCYLSIKKIKTGKFLLTTIALFPFNIFTASNITYDWWVTSLIILGVSTFLSAQQQPLKKWKFSDSIMISGPIFLACVTKMIYFPLLVIPYFLEKQCFNIKSNKYKHILITSAFILISLTIFIFITLNASSSVGDIRGGSDVNSANQLQYIINNPISYASTLFSFLLNYLSINNAVSYASGFGYLGALSDMGIFIVLMIVCTIIDRNKYDYYSTKTKIKLANIVIFLIIISMIPTALYISYTPVASSTINGCQPRYIVPLLFPLLATIGTYKIKNYLSDVSMKLIIFIPICCLMLWDIANIMLSKML